MITTLVSEDFDVSEMNGGPACEGSARRERGPQREQSKCVWRLVALFVPVP